MIYDDVLFLRKFLAQILKQILMSAKSKYTVMKNKLNTIESHADPHDSVKVNTSLKISDNLIWINLRTPCFLTAELKISIYYPFNLIGVNMSYWFSSGIITRLQHSINI